MKKVINILLSFKTTIFLLSLLAIGAGVATFIENDYGSSTARVLVYNNIWYEVVLALTGVNLLGAIIKRKMWKNLPLFLFHAGFLVILLGAAITRYIGYEGLMHIREGKTTNKMITQEPYLQVTIKSDKKRYYKEYKKELSALGGNNFNYNIAFGKMQNINLSFANYSYTKKGMQGIGMLSVKVCNEGKCKVEKLIGQRAMKGFPKLFDFGKTKVIVEYGSKVIKLPFNIKLVDFKLDRYAGSMAPSSYSSQVELIDKSKKLNYNIYMNHTLNYGGYKFFQSSYDQDEMGTILSVNRDPGKIPTYIGYLMLILGFIGNLFSRKSRFSRLIKFVKNSTPALLLFLSLPLFSNQLDSYLKEFKVKSLQSAKEFSKLMVQTNMGRVTTLDSLNKQLLYKIHSSSSFRGLNANQVILGMLSNPQIWSNAKLIKVKSPKLKELLNVKKEQKYIALSSAFANKQYKLQNEVERANRLSPNKRGTLERELITLDEKLNIIYSIFYGEQFKIYPQKGSSSGSWQTPLKAMEKFIGADKKAVESMTHTLIDSLVDNNYKEANSAIEQIKEYQYRYGRAQIPTQSKIEAEFLYNNLDIFPKLVPIYLIIGIILLIFGFAEVLSANKKSLFVWTKKLFIAILFILFLIHTFGLGLRWFISGHAPWSDAYESLLYISWSALMAGLLFFRSSLLVLSATTLVAGVFMFSAHLSNINPQITNLVPVLKSYWLTIHVSVITASYGFLGLSAVISYLVLILFILRSPKRANIDNSIYNLMAVNEASLIIGLSMLSVGNFLGGVWANESWGRYWGWDPKETWAYISIVIYTIVLHLRLIKSLDKPFILAVASFLAFSSILMTYFGVNFYLSGMHSYATGDPVPVPSWVYVAIVVAVVTITLAYPKRNLKRIKL